MLDVYKLRSFRNMNEYYLYTTRVPEFKFGHSFMQGNGVAVNKYNLTAT